MNGENKEEKIEEIVQKVTEKKPRVPIEEESQLEKSDLEEIDKAAAPEKDEVVVKRKVTKKYYVKVKTIVKNENRTIEKKTLSFLVKGIDEREDTSAKSNEERFQLSIKSKGKKELYLYLNGDRTVSSIEIEGIKYLVRGH